MPAGISSGRVPKRVWTTANERDGAPAPKKPTLGPTSSELPQDAPIATKPVLSADLDLFQSLLESGSAHSRPSAPGPSKPGRRVRSTTNMQPPEAINSSRSRKKLANTRPTIPMVACHFDEATGRFVEAVSQQTAPRRLRTRITHPRLYTSDCDDLDTEFALQSSNHDFGTKGQTSHRLLYDSSPSNNLIHLTDMEIPIHVTYPPNAAANDTLRIANKLSRHARRQLSCARRWGTDVLPHLIRPYMQYIRLSDAGHVSTMLGSEPVICKCSGDVVKRNVTCVYMDRESCI